MEAKEQQGENPFRPVSLTFFMNVMKSLLRTHRSANGFMEQSIRSGLKALLRLN